MCTHENASKSINKYVNHRGVNWICRLWGGGGGGGVGEDSNAMQMLAKIVVAVKSMPEQIKLKSIEKRVLVPLRVILENS